MRKYTSKIILIVTLCSVCFVTYRFYNVTNIEDTSTKNIKQNNNMLSMMIETEAKSGKYESSTTSTWPTDGYIFNSNLSKCENGGTLSWDSANKKVLFEGNNIDKCYVYFDVVPPMSLAEYVVSQYTGTQGENGIYYHDSSLTNGAGDNSYRYAGANPNNYVCFGSDNATCPYENLHRIIGVIDGKAKLILADATSQDMLNADDGNYTTYVDAGYTTLKLFYKGSKDYSDIGLFFWNLTGSDTLDVSSTSLTAHYLAYLDKKNTKWRAMIDNTTWYVGGLTGNNGRYTNAKTVYDYELGTNKISSKTATAKIGLMYLSEYFYGASPEYWMLAGHDKSGSWSNDDWVGNDYSKALNYNWMATGLYEWTISAASDDSESKFYILDVGFVNWSTINSTLYVTRPTFSISSSVSYAGGTGSQSDPIRIK